MKLSKSKNLNKILPLGELTAVTPLDGRYRKITSELAPYISEYALIKTRFEVEARYLLALSDIGIIRQLSARERQRLNSFGQNITLQDAEEVKKIEAETRHDVKAVERAFRQMVNGTSLENIIEMVHFGLTSEDINNLAYRLMLKRATENVCIPLLDKLINELVVRAERYKETPMLGRTHGQAAVPTTIGKELIVFASRLNGQARELKNSQLTGKLAGAVGNLNALQLAYPDIDWLNFSKNFVGSFGFKPNLITTQINPSEDIIAYFQNYQRINGVIIDLDQDMWRYISDYWFIQEVKKGEIGSSTMPQKVNPIDFENSEGNLGMANAIFDFLARKLAISRLQRDLSDSTVIRNIGTVLSYSLVGYKSALAGLSRVRPNKEKIHEDLNKDWVILAEGVQTILRKIGVKDPYSLITSLTRGEHLGEKSWKKWINKLPVDSKYKRVLEKLTPSGYIGLAVELTESAICEIKAKK